MSGETRQDVSGWTIDTLKAFNDMRAEMQAKIDAMNDRRLAEVAVEREKALKIKEEADKAALALAREIQTYKDEKANELREQINSERGLYASKGDLVAATEKIEAMIKPLQEYVSSAGGKWSGLQSLYALIAAAGVLVALFFALKGH